MANLKLTEEASAGRRFSLLIGALSAALILGGGLVMLLFFLALGFANWIRSQPEPAVILLGDSMPPTLRSLDVVYLRPPDPLRRGDIISYHYGSSRISHRIVGLPGERVTVTQGRVHIGQDADTTALEEPYVKYPGPHWETGPITLDQHEYLTLGDNRAAASGRGYHIVPREAIVGVVYRIIFPPWRARLLEE